MITALYGNHNTFLFATKVYFQMLTNNSLENQVENKKLIYTIGITIYINLFNFINVFSFSKLFRLTF